MLLQAANSADTGILVIFFLFDSHAAGRSSPAPVLSVLLGVSICRGQFFLLLLLLGLERKHGHVSFSTPFFAQAGACCSFWSPFISVIVSSIRCVLLEDIPLLVMCQSCPEHVNVWNGNIRSTFKSGFLFPGGEIVVTLWR